MVYILDRIYLCKIKWKGFKIALKIFVHWLKQLAGDYYEGFFFFSIERILWLSFDVNMHRILCYSYLC